MEGRIESKIARNADTGKKSTSESTLPREPCHVKRTRRNQQKVGVGVRCHTRGSFVTNTVPSADK